ncbi:dipeptidase [Pelobacter propionicus]|uniref:Dipeptidase, Metallo peptidase, MEROPS family M19 n=1 Tax=Pelobacter propionicus (strain DSM 2379 / NBRC 103807 / OttBd1) TaxID=338966 RepID=A1AS60_PELPD|nr:membrane dipeptidase [Pelobacter propionicus]ABL00181.1 dipeptidase, Metallo peptidase, MEROPS family M19 [Pelobacter propionicus DSM 2379]
MKRCDPKRPWPVIDAHVDLLHHLMARHPNTRLVDLPHAWVSIPRLREGEVRVMVSAFYCPDSHNGPVTASAHLRSLLEYADTYLDGLAPIRTPRELAACWRGEDASGCLRLLENGDALLEFPVEELKRRGFSVVGLTHGGRNRLADGNGVEHPEGLTPAGRELLRELERLGFAIDTAHLSEPAFRDVVEQFGGPLICSHGGLRSFFRIPRNLSAEQVRTILSRGGVVGIAAAPEILSPDGRADIRTVFAQIDRLVQRNGAEAVGIGSDFGGFDSVCDGLEDHSRLPRLGEMLERAGYGEEAVAGIMGGNWFRFFRRLLTDSSVDGRHFPVGSCLDGVPSGRAFV